jgi:hypothetical protein
VKFVKLILLLLCLAPTAAILAQSNPTVEIILDQATAQQGDVVTAEVYVRNATNIGGADIGVTMDNQCLKILERLPGEFLPSTSEGGGFSPYSELNDHDTRFALAITDRSKLGNGGGVFMRLRLQVTCEQAVAALNVSFAELSAYKDPAATEVELIPYTMDTNTVITIGTQLLIGPDGSITVVAPTPPENNVTVVAPVAAETSVTPAAAATTAAPATAEETSKGQISILAILGVAALGLGSLFVVFMLMRRRTSEDDEI